jgi:hypothetical protein
LKLHHTFLNTQNLQKLGQTGLPFVPVEIRPIGGKVTVTGTVPPELQAHLDDLWPEIEALLRVCHRQRFGWLA